MPLLADFGLGMQGANAARRDQQSYDIGQQEIADRQQQARAREQAIRTQQLGLDTLERQTGDTLAARNAAAQSIGAGGTLSGSLLDMSDALAARGDVHGAVQYRQAHQQLEDMGARDVIHQVFTDPTPGDRPDVVQMMRRNESTKDVTGATLDERGNLTVTRAGKAPTTLNVGVLAERMGMVKPPTVHTIAPSGSALITQPGTEPRLVTAPPATKFGGTRNGVIYNQVTGEVAWSPPEKDKESWMLGEIQNGDRKVPVSFNRTTGEAVALGPGGGAEKAAVHTDATGKTMVTIGGQVFELQPGSPEVPASSGFLGFGAKPGVPAQPSRLTPVQSPSAPPAPGARQAPDGNWYTPDPNRPGKFMKVLTGASDLVQRGPPAQPQPIPNATAGTPTPTPLAAPRTALRPAAAPAKPAVAVPAPAGLEPNPATEAKRAEVERFNQALSVGGTQPGRQEKIAQKQSQIAKEFPQRLQRFNKQDQTWLAQNAADLTPAQRKQYRDRQARAQYGG